MRDLLDLFGFLLFLLFDFLLNLRLVFLLFGIFFLLLFFFIIRLGDFLILGFFNEKLDGESNELRVLLNEILKAALSKELKLVLLHVENDLASTSKALTFVLVNSEGAASVGLPTVLLVVITLGDDSDALSNEVSRVKPNTELTDHRNISASRNGLHESLGA